MLLYIFYTKCFPEYSYTVLQQPDSKYCQKQKACPLLAHRRKLSKKVICASVHFFIQRGYDHEADVIWICFQIQDLMVCKGWEAVIWVLSAAAAAAVYKQHATLPWNVALKKMRTRFQLDSIYARFSLIFILLSFQGSWNAPVQSVRSLRSQGIIAFAGIDSILSTIILTEDEVVVGHPSSSMLPPSSKLPLSYLRNPVPLPGTFHKVFKREAGVFRIMEKKTRKNLSLGWGDCWGLITGSLRLKAELQVASCSFDLSTLMGPSELQASFLL